MNHEVVHEKKQPPTLSLFQKIKVNGKKILIGALVLAVLGFFIVQRKGTNGQKQQYQTTKVTRGTIVSSISASGQIISAGNMPVTTQTSGIVTSIFVKNGDIVSAGAKLFEMTPDQQSLAKQTQAWASYLSAKNSLDSANQTLFTLQSDLFTKWKIYMDLAQSSQYQNSDLSPRYDQRNLPQFWSPKDDWLASEAKFKNQQGVIAAAQAGLTSAWNAYQAVSPVITAPIAGRVEDITLVLGMVISPQTNSSGASTAQRLATIKTETNPIASFNLPEIDVTKVKADQKVTVVLDALTGKTFTGKVIGVDKTGVVSSSVTNYPTTVQFDTNAADVLSNMSATANIIINSKHDVLLVPSTAVQTNDGQASVRLMKNRNPVSTPVETGISSDSQMEIVSGVHEGDEIVTGIISTGSSTSASSPFSALGRGGFGGGAVFRGGR